MDKKTTQKALLALTGICILIFCVIALQPPADGWHVRNGQTSYYLNGKPLTGWHDIAQSRCYFGEDGILRTGWQEIGGKRYYFAEDGSMVTGWFMDAH